MGIESTYSFPASIERVFAALTDPDTLRYVVPGCERLIQLGPAEDDGTFAWEARLRLGQNRGLYTARGTVEHLRKPAHVALTLRADGPHGSLPVRGSIDLAAHDGQTVAALAWAIDTRNPVDGQADGLDEMLAAQLVRLGCERLAGLISDANNAAQRVPVLRAETGRGKIIELPPESPETGRGGRLRPMLVGAAWTGTGLAAGVAAIMLASAIVRRRGSSTAAK